MRNIKGIDDWIGNITHDYVANAKNVAAHEIESLRAKWLSEPVKFLVKMMKTGVFFTPLFSEILKVDLKTDMRTFVKTDLEKLKKEGIIKYHLFYGDDFYLLIFKMGDDTFILKISTLFSMRSLPDKMDIKAVTCDDVPEAFKNRMIKFNESGLTYAYAHWMNGLMTDKELSDKTILILCKQGEFAVDDMFGDWDDNEFPSCAMIMRHDIMHELHDDIELLGMINDKNPDRTVHSTLKEFRRRLKLLNPKSITVNDRCEIVTMVIDAVKKVIQTDDIENALDELNNIEYDYGVLFQLFVNNLTSYLKPFLMDDYYKFDYEDKDSWYGGKLFAFKSKTHTILYYEPSPDRPRSNEAIIVLENEVFSDGDKLFDTISRSKLFWLNKPRRNKKGRKE